MLPTMKQRQNTIERTLLGMVCGEQRRIMHIQREVEKQFKIPTKSLDFTLAALEAIELGIREKIAARAPTGEIAKKLKEAKARKARERTAL